MINIQRRGITAHQRRLETISRFLDVAAETVAILSLPVLILAVWNVPTDPFTSIKLLSVSVGVLAVAATLIGASQAAWARSRAVVSSITPEQICAACRRRDASRGGWQYPSCTTFTAYEAIGAHEKRAKK